MKCQVLFLFTILFKFELVLCRSPFGAHQNIKGFHDGNNPNVVMQSVVLNKKKSEDESNEDPEIPEYLLRRLARMFYDMKRGDYDDDYEDERYLRKREQPRRKWKREDSFEDFDKRIKRKRSWKRNKHIYDDSEEDKWDIPKWENTKYRPTEELVELLPKPRRKNFDQHREIIEEPKRRKKRPFAKKTNYLDEEWPKDGKKTDTPQDVLYVPQYGREHYSRSHINSEEY